MTLRQDIVSSLILAPIRSGLRGFCLFILGIFLKEYQQKNPLKYYALPLLIEVLSNVYSKLFGFAEAKRYRKINFFATSALCKCSFSG
jgi:ABC-type phosphate transport system permease subunit